MLNFFKDKVAAGAEQELPLILINDTYQDWKGNIVVSLLKDGREVMKKTVQGNVASLGKENYNATFRIPAEKGAYQFMAAINYGGDVVKSVREFVVE